MFLLQVAQVPVPVDLSDGRRLMIPKMPMEDVVAWGQEIMSERAERVTEGMSEDQMREYFTFYPAIPPDLRELRSLLRTVNGVKRVLETCLPRAKVYKINPDDSRGEELPNLTSEEVKQIVAGGVGPLSVVAFELSDLNESPAYKKKPEKNNTGEDPLPGSGKQDSKTSAMTGRKTSRSGTQSIQT